MRQPLCIQTTEYTGLTQRRWRLGVPRVAEGTDPIDHALAMLPEPDQRRLGTSADQKHGPRELAGRRAERILGLAADQDGPDGTAVRCDAADLTEPARGVEPAGVQGSRNLAGGDPDGFGRPPGRHLIEPRIKARPRIRLPESAEVLDAASLCS